MAATQIRLTSMCWDLGLICIFERVYKLLDDGRCLYLLAMTPASVRAAHQLTLGIVNFDLSTLMEFRLLPANDVSAPVRSLAGIELSAPGADAGGLDSGRGRDYPRIRSRPGAERRVLIMRNFIQPGVVRAHRHCAGRCCDRRPAVIVGVAACTAAAGVEVEISPEGVFDLAKTP